MLFCRKEAPLILKKIQLARALLLLLLLAVTLPLLSGCGNQPVEQSFFAMDTLFTLRIYGTEAQAAMDAANALILEAEQRYDVRDPASEVARINANAGEWTTVSADTVVQIQMVQELSQTLPKTFSLSLYPVSLLWGFGTPSPTVPTQNALKTALEAVDDQKIEIDIAENKIRIPKDMALDFGGLAKGYLGQQLTQLLQSYNVDAAYLSLGGNVQLYGEKPDQTPWKIGLADPASPNETVGVLTVSPCAIVTSGSYQRNFTENGQTYHHILDPNTGMPAENGCASVTVICQNGAQADLLSTAFFVAGYETMVTYWNAHPELEFLWIGTDGNIRISQGIAEKFTPIDPYRSITVENRQNA